jgi:hypothetical protein
MQTVYIGNTLINDFRLGTQIIDDVFTVYNGFDNDVKNFVNASKVSNPTTINALDTFVTSLKSNNLWNKFYALYPFVGGNSQSNRYNLINTGSYLIAFTGSWTFNDNGITGDGSTAYGNTYLSVPATNFSGSATIFNYSRTTGITGIDMGSEGLGPGPFYIANRYTGNLTYFSFDISATTSASLDGSGLYMGVSSGSTQLVYRNGSQSFSTNKTAGQNPAANFYIGSNNFRDNASDFSNRNFAMAGFANSFNLSQASTFYTIVQNFQTALGRQV